MAMEVAADGFRDDATMLNLDFRIDQGERRAGITAIEGFERDARRSRCSLPTLAEEYVGSTSITAAPCGSAVNPRRSN
jgi:hypothetical protein